MNLEFNIRMKYYRNRIGHRIKSIIEKETIF